MKGADSRTAVPSGNEGRAPVSRTSFFNGYWKAVDERGWVAVVLHGWADFPEHIESDVDYAVSGPSRGELLRFLAAHCRSRGWLLVQVIEHEPGAYYCVCMQDGSSFEWLALDVTWDYRRIGHLLMSSERLVEDWRRVDGKVFLVPSRGAECCYLLAKGAAKGKLFGEIRDRVATLLAEDSEGCRRVVSATFSPDFPKGDGDVQHLEAVSYWYDHAPALSRVRSGRRFGVAEIGLYLRRIIHPAGFRLVLTGGNEESPSVEELVDRLVPVFRRIQRRGRVNPLQFPDVLQRVIRTTLVVEQRDAGGRKMQLGLLIDPRERDVTCLVLRHLAARIDTRIQNL